jgi:alpha-glucosidase
VSAAPWWREAAGYQVYLPSFADGDGDGVGDLAGLRRRLGHLAALGVDALWVSPFYPSPQVDGGYDVSDHRGVDPRFGDLSDVDTLVADAHALGLRVLVDVVPNHTSDAHPWFRAARSAGPGDTARARYHFLPGRGPDGARPPNGWRSMFGGPAWTRLPDGEWYLHLFAPEQPDLNWTDEEVAGDFDTTLRFWLDRGVDGVRVDVAGGLCKDPGYRDVVPDADVHPHWDRPELLAVHRRWRRLLESYPGDRVAVGEMWGPPNRIAYRVGSGGLHQIFQFDWAVVPWSAADLRVVAEAALAELGRAGALPTWLLGSHDLPRPVSRYGGPHGLRRARAKALMTLALPGAVWLYQGEELGLPDVSLPDPALRDPTWERSGHTERGRDGVRVPYPWSADQPGYGFTGGVPWLPQPPEWAELAAGAQRGVPGSTLELYRAALALRRRWLIGEDCTWLAAAPGVVALRRGPVVCALNAGGRPAEPPVAGEPLLCSAELGAGGELPPDSAAWFLAEGAPAPRPPA